MLHITPDAPDESALAELAAHRLAITTAGDYSAQVVEAARRWKAKAPEKMFIELRARLESACPGIRRCMYCEDSLADEIEHRRPKNLFPADAFSWTNLLLACGPCNGPKGDQYALLVEGRLVDITRSRVHGTPVLAPVPGADALIDLRAEMPSELLRLDLDTFRFVAEPGASETDRIRADYTIRLLRLNARETLVRARHVAYRKFFRVLSQYIDCRETWTEQNVNDTIQIFRDEPHRTVWEEMKRQRPCHPELEELFAAAPEALGW